MMSTVTSHPSHVVVELRLKTPPGVFCGPVFYGATGRLLRVQVSCPSYGQMPGGLSTFELKFLVFSRYSTGILSNCYDSIQLAGFQCNLKVKDLLEYKKKFKCKWQAYAISVNPMKITCFHFVYQTVSTNKSFQTIYLFIINLYNNYSIDIY